MFELFEESFKAANLPATIALIFVLLYWCIVMLGMVDFDLYAEAGGSVAGGIPGHGLDVMGADCSGVPGTGVRSDGVLSPDVDAVDFELDAGHGDVI